MGDGQMVLSDIARFKQAQSEPMMKCDEEQKEDMNVKQKKSYHHRTKKTIFGRLLEAVPVNERKDLNITIHSDFSLAVAEKPRHFKAETAKLAFTLKPVHNMKILM